MNLVSRNFLIIALATATLLGGLFNSPYVEPLEAANVPSIERLRFEDRTPSVPSQSPTTTTISLAASNIIELSGHMYVPIRDYVEARRGQLIYNRETTSVDITIDNVSFSLLLGEGVLMSNGRAMEGSCFVQHGVAYIAIDTLSNLLNKGAAASSA